jgi:signal transduction histidine kinase
MDVPSSPARSTTLRRYQRLAEQGHAHLVAVLRLAALSLGSPHALLARLGPDRRAFDAVVGMDRRAAAPLLPFCSYALLHPEGFEVADARASDAFASFPAVRAGSVGMVVGAALRDASGELEGAFVVVDARPRALTDAQREALSAAAAALSHHLAHERELDAVRARHAEHLRALDVLRGVLRGARRLAIVAADLEGRVTSLNEGAAALLRYEAVPRGLTLDALFDVDELDRAAVTANLPGTRAGRGAVLRSLAAGDEGDSRDWTWRRADGSAVPVHATLHAVRDEDGSLSGYVAVAQDITERIAVARMKDDFIAAVSHELRTPLTSIRGAVGLLGGGVAGPLSDDAAELVTLAAGQCVQLERLVDDLLDLARLRVGRVELRRSECQLAALVQHAVAVHGPYASTLQVSLRFGDDPDTRAASEARVVVDPDRVLQVLANLLSNAAKFSPPESVVTVRMRRVGASVRVLVEDRGAGVPEALRAHVFERFMRADPPGVDGARARGTGLGLSIAKALVERHGGAIGFDTETGRGSTFWFDLPALGEPA